MPDQSLTEAGRGLDQLRDIISQAKGVPMSASCVVNRAEMLELVDRIRAVLPEELGRAQGLLANSDAEAEAIVSAARAQATRMAEDHEIAREARGIADELRRATEQECADLRRETDLFIDSRLAAFESELHRTSSQVATARQRLAERSALDDNPLDSEHSD
ncbi:MAG TPA: hypothetical protein GXZ30_05400 [Propionibacterium sp.]|jgi:cell division septum initiation protein DivIVA|nr:hypothetical protein [Propionibacterium sp.]